MDRRNSEMSFRHVAIRDVATTVVQAQIVVGGWCRCVLSHVRHDVEILRGVPAKTTGCRDAG